MRMGGRLLAGLFSQNFLSLSKKQEKVWADHTSQLIVIEHSKRPVNKIHTIKEHCISNKIPKEEMEDFLYKINAACNYSSSEAPIQYINKMIKQGNTLTLKRNYKLFQKITRDEAIAFFKLAPYGATPKEFFKYKKLFVTDPKNHSFYGGIGGSVANRFTRALEACEYLLKSGLTFNQTVQHIIEINRLSGSDTRFMAITYQKLPMVYAKTFSDAQIQLHDSLRSHDNLSEKKLSNIITPEKIVELNISNDCDPYKLTKVLKHFLMTQKESWENTVEIINGSQLKNKSPDLFGKNKMIPNADYINKVLYSRIFRDQVKEKWNVTLDDTCTWFNEEVDVKAFSKYMAFLVKTNKEMPSASVVDMVIAELKKLNSSQKWIIAVGGLIDEAQLMYTDKLYWSISPMLFEEEHALRDLKKFREGQVKFSDTNSLKPR